MLKRSEIEAFLEQQLPRRVEEAFWELAGEEQVAPRREISALAQDIRDEVAEDALLADGPCRARQAMSI